MAQKVRVLNIDDLDGSPADEKVRFALDGTEYEIDLSAPHAEEMRAELAPWIGKARRQRQSRAQRRPAGRPKRTDLADIREYARARGYDVKERGQVPKAIVREYDLLKKYAKTEG